MYLFILIIIVFVAYFGQKILRKSVLFKKMKRSIKLVYLKSTVGEELIPKSVNYHYTRQCNYTCGFCFHTAKTSYVLPFEEAKRGLKMLYDAGMEKLNFSGGEPFIYKKGKYMGDLIKYCKLELGLASVSIVSNGSLITEQWLMEYGEWLDILAISCDSFNEETNKKIGRFAPSKEHVEQLYRVRGWCDDYKVLFKLNSTICVHNVEENMVQELMELKPCRWKVFQCLLIEGENAGPSALRNAEQMVITDNQFECFLQRHKQIECLVPESNEKMRNSYLILDEYMRFLNNQGGEKEAGKSILDIGVQQSMPGAGFDDVMFKKRGGVYKWSKLDQMKNF